MYADKFRNFAEEFFESEKHRLPNFIPVGIGTGISFYFSLNEEPNFFINSMVFLLTAGAFIAFRRRFFCALLTLSLGFFVAQVRTRTVDTFMLSETDNRPTSLTATAESCEKTENGLTFVADDVHCKAYPELKKLRLTWRGKKALEEKTDYIPGSRILFRAILFPVHPQAFPGAYDFKKQQYFKGTGAGGFIIRPPKILRTSTQTGLHTFIGRLRHFIDKKIETHLRKDTAAVTKALVTGNKSGISKKVRSDFANSGTAHLLAISGLHMGIIGFFVFWLFRVLLCCFPCICMFRDIKKIAAVISWATVLFYLYVSGSSVPSVRAFIMHGIVILAVLIGRNALTMRSAAIAASIIMILSPEAVMFPSFQMSFGAVIAIIALYEKLPAFTGFFKTLIGVTATTLAASIPTALFSIYTFNQLTLNSVPANIVSVPLMSFFVMPLIVIMLFFMIFDRCRPFIDLVGYGTDLLMKISELCARLPGSFFVMPTPTAIIMAIFIFSGLILMLIRHRIRWLGLVGAAAGILCYRLTPLPDVFISPQAKAIGIRTEDAVCFNRLNYFRSATSSWAKSVGFERKNRFDSEVCRKCITQVSDNSWLITLRNFRVLISDTPESFPSETNIIFADKNCNFAKLFCVPSGEYISNEHKKRPWSR
ncbi:MAG: ComEC family competence protein [Holosporaceae bacterium]|jgi:competence protein ComEC|nr:ComEC family competence protein [Holosporaceae bacterium]